MSLGRSESPCRLGFGRRGRQAIRWPAFVSNAPYTAQAHFQDCLRIQFCPWHDSAFPPVT
eukprot:CAMPEP_0206520208 /NCGR_PEP_ID=MMETSP0324_2-20121206/65631_1 /ASSEMBLY_ACC=CAM_ASM_000836 /TAXON_ID=2866 /ORGANISM="Crypthecodinium cohnii, Strain Seligo" /LENGTH=59 /DNA_ID=CAMNT_0054013899 /DNA_START=52 /DNA_END=231 /DNA_ORIENTATION=-